MKQKEKISRLRELREVISIARREYNQLLNSILGNSKKEGKK